MSRAIARLVAAVCLPLAAWLSACDDLAATDAAADTPAVVVAPLHDPVRAKKELFITDLSVVRDAELTAYAPNHWNADREGAWSFARLMDNIGPIDRPSDRQRSDFVMKWMRLWETDQVVNGQVIAARPLVRAVLIDPWKQRSIGKLPGNTAAACAPGAATDFVCKLGFAPGVVPFQLIAIVNRPDLRVLPVGNDATTGAAGQGRFVFMMVDANQQPLPFTAIFEFMVPIKDLQTIKSYHDGWHALGTKAFGRPFNDALLANTKKFAARKVAPWRENGSALLQLRTNDVMFAEPGSDPSHPFGVLWEMREFVLAADGSLAPDTTKQEPPIALSGSAVLSEWLSENEAAVRAGTHVVPASYLGGPFLAASSLVPNDFRWSAPGIDEPLRKQFALGTCNGCHRNETDTFFLHVFPLDPATPEATLSAFLQGELAEPDGARVKDMTWVLEQDWKKLGDGKGKDKGNHPHSPPPPPAPPTPPGP